MKRIRFIVLLVSITFTFSYSQIKVNKIEPPNWWAGMKYNSIQLMVYGENLNDVKVTSNGLKISKVHTTPSGSYLFIDIDLSKNQKPGNYEILLSNSNGTSKVSFPLLARGDKKGRFQGYSQKDVIYLITPDRFVNGDPANDNVPGMLEGKNSASGMGRHGGDIQGIINRLDYIKDLGFTAVWINPLVENNCPYLSYHGYGATDLYKIDPRFGTNELYKSLVDAAHAKGLKIIFDHVNNHISNYHPWLNNLPFNDWLNLSKENHYITSHNKKVFSDPYAGTQTIDTCEQGWFVEEMPDLNQRNPFVSKYLTQNMIWWIEYSGLDGIREDTYPYTFEGHSAVWNKAILDEYPEFNIMGEAWLNDPIYLSYFQKNNKTKGFNSNLPAILDFALSNAFQEYLSGKSTLMGIYETLAKDYLYPDPENLVTFIDNHDMPRGLFTAKENYEKMKSAIFMLLTLRGIPQIFYATEIAMVGGESHSDIRTDFPGDIPEMNRGSAFTKKGRLPIENEFYDFTQKLLGIRKNYPAIAEGNLLHFPPENDIYYYFRYDTKNNFLCVVNGSSKEQNINFAPVIHKLKGVSLVSLLSGEKISPGSGVTMAPYKTDIYKIIK